MQCHHEPEAAKAYRQADAGLNARRKSEQDQLTRNTTGNSLRAEACSGKSSRRCRDCVLKIVHSWQAAQTNDATVRHL